MKKHLLGFLAAVTIAGIGGVGGAALAGENEPPIYKAPATSFELNVVPGGGDDAWHNVMTWCLDGVRFAETSHTGLGRYGGAGAAVAMILDPGCKE